VLDLTHLKDYAWETEYLSQIFDLIPEIKGVALHWRSERLFRRWFPRLRSKFLKTKLRIPRNVDGDTVLIILSDELYRVPPSLPALTVFKQYAAIEDRISIPFPLGFQRGFPAVAPQPIGKRPIDVGFLGRMYPHRKAFLTELTNHPKLRSFRLNLTSEARVSVPEYSAFLNDARISLCLPGNYSPETFRFYESMKIGCIVVSVRMPENGLYRSHPGFQVDDFNDVNHVAEVLQSILEVPEQFDSLQLRSLEAWESHYSPAAVAAMIKNVVESKVTADSSEGN
jgi:hypothetical protein